MSEHAPPVGSAVDATSGVGGRHGATQIGAHSGEPAFDAVNPPSAALIGDCVHCGFCLPTCPTYVLWAEEMDSPRGRIYLMGQGLEGEPMTPTMVGHFDACLGCMACVTACPSGVQYDKLIAATRAQVERRYDRPWRDRALRRAIFAVFPYPRRLRVMRGPLRAYQAIGPTHAAALPRHTRQNLAGASVPWNRLPPPSPGQNESPNTPRPAAFGAARSGCSSAACNGSSFPA